MAFLEELRDTSNLHLVSEALLQSFVTLSSIDMADVRWAFAPVAVLSQEERGAMNMLKALQFARYHQVPLVRWRRQLSRSASSWLDAEEVEEARRHESAMWGVFVQGAPALLCENMNVARGLCNGTAGVLHSLSVANADVLQDAEL
jgi:hypothetical protein